MNKVTFIDADYFYDNTASFSKNIDDENINPIILRAQDMYIAPILGSDFYEYLMNEVYEAIENNHIMNSDDELLVNDYIQLALVHWTAYLAVTPLRVKATNKSMSTENSQYSFSAQKADVQELKAEYRAAAEFYSDRLKTYLCKYSNLYPVFENPSDKENLKKQDITYGTGFYVSKNNRKKGCC